MVSTSFSRFLAPLSALALLAAACSSATSDESLSASEAEAQACNDSPPDGAYSCAQQKQWGKCGESWMQGHCQTACGTCAKATACTDVPDGSGYSCAQQKGVGEVR